MLYKVFINVFQRRINLSWIKYIANFSNKFKVGGARKLGSGPQNRMKGRGVCRMASAAREFIKPFQPSLNQCRNVSYLNN